MPKATYSDWGATPRFWLDRCAGRLCLAQLGRRVGDLNYTQWLAKLLRAE